MGEKMKKMTINRQMDAKNHAKKVAISHNSEDAESKTQVSKSFQYTVSRNVVENPVAEAPQVHIKKAFDSKNKQEKFNFQVKGYFFMKHKGELVKVNFHHALDIKITWKSKDFSPKKSAVLTK